MNREEFIKYIESIGFIYNDGDLYRGFEEFYYKHYTIKVYYGYYAINGAAMKYNDLRLIGAEFKKEIRKFKLKQLLG